MQEFPNFEKLSLNHRQEIDAVLKTYPPYSDVNFVGMYEYDTQDRTRVCMLKNSLVFILTDYITGEDRITFVGLDETDVITETLLEYASENTKSKCLKLIPEIAINAITSKDRYLFTEDENNFDYIIDVKDMLSLSGRRWHGVRKELSHFVRNYEYQFTQIELNDRTILKQVVDLCVLWAKQKGESKEETEVEFEALNRSLTFANDPDHFAFGLYIDGKMIGFSINQAVHDGYYIGHFGKADLNYPGAYKIIEYECAKFFDNKGYRYLNLEQDLGIPGLRIAKSGWNPVFYLKKYTVEMKR